MNIKQMLLKNIGKNKGSHYKYFLLALVAVMVAASIASIVLASSVSDSFSDETKIGKGTAIVNINTTAHTVTLPACYTASTAWNFVVTTNVRNIAGAYNATVDKDIYCDDLNCVLWTYSAGHDTPAIPATVCIATNANVYGNILWEVGNTSSSKTWGPASGISGGDLQGQMPSPLGVGAGNSAVGGASILARYYTSAVGTYLAMDACKGKGSGWRLPTILELDSIRDQAKGGAPYSRLPGIVSNLYWSSTEFSSTGAWRLYFSYGDADYGTKSNGYYVRCVRGY